MPKADIEATSSGADSALRETVTQSLESWVSWFERQATQIVKGGMALIGLALLGGVGYVARNAVSIASTEKDAGDATPRIRAREADEHGLAIRDSDRTLAKYESRQSLTLADKSALNLPGSSDVDIADGKIDFGDEVREDTSKSSGESAEGIEEIFTPAARLKSTSNANSHLSFSGGFSGMFSGRKLLATQPPVVVNNQLTIQVGKTKVLTSTELMATDPDTSYAALAFIASDVQHGHFEKSGSTVLGWQQDDITNSKISFIHDGGYVAPTYSISVSDGTTTVTAPRVKSVLWDDFLPLTGEITALTSFSDRPTSASLSNGRLIVAGESCGSTACDFYGKIFNADGSVYKEKFLLYSQSQLNHGLEIAQVDTNKILMVYFRYTYNLGGEIDGRIYDLDGNYVQTISNMNGEVFQFCYSTGGHKVITTLNTTPKRYLVSWFDDYNVHFRLIDQNGNLYGAALSTKVTAAPVYGSSVAVVILDSSKFTVINEDYSHTFVMERRFRTTDGSALDSSSYNLITPASQCIHGTNAVLLNSGRYVVTTAIWPSAAGGVSIYDLNGYIFNSDKTLYSTFSIATPTYSNINYVGNSMKSLNDGGFVVVWTTATSEAPATNWAVYGQLFDTTANKYRSQFRVSPLGGEYPYVSVLTNGNVAVSYHQLSLSGSGSCYCTGLRIFGQNYSPLLTAYTLPVTAGTNVTLSETYFNVTDPDSDYRKTVYTMSSVQRGWFESMGNVTTSFLQSDIGNGLVRFVHNGTSIAPSFLVAVSDGILSSSPIPAIINFTQHPPVVSNPLATQALCCSAGIGQVYSFAFASNTFTDPDGDTLTYNATTTVGSALPGWLSFNAATRALSGTPTSAGDISNLAVKVTATDPGSLSVSDTFTLAIAKTLTATNTNTAVSYTEDTQYNFTSPIVVTTPSATITVQLTLNDLTIGVLPTNTSGSVTSTYNAGTGVWRASGAKANVNALLAGLKFNPAADKHDAFSIAVSVTDGYSQSLTDTISVVGISVNDAPRVSNAITTQASCCSTGIGQVYSFAFASNTFTDPDGDTLTYTATRADGSALPGWLSFNAATRTLSGTPTSASDITNLAVKVTATDPGLLSVSDTFTLQVAKTLSATNTNVAIAYAENTQYSFASPIVVTTPSSTVTVQLTINDPTIGALTVGASGSVISTYNAATGVWNASGAKADVNILLAGLKFNPASNKHDAFSIAVSISDSYSQSLSDTINAVGTGVPHYPVVSSIIASQSLCCNATASQLYRFTFASNTFTDPDGDILTYTAALADGSALPSWLSFTSGTRTFSGVPSDGQSINIKVTANDGTGRTVADTFTLQVSGTQPQPSKSGGGGGDDNSLLLYIMGPVGGAGLLGIASAIAGAMYKREKRISLLHIRYPLANALRLDMGLKGVRDFDSEKGRRLVEMAEQIYKSLEDTHGISYRVRDKDEQEAIAAALKDAIINHSGATTVPPSRGVGVFFRSRNPHPTYLLVYTAIDQKLADIAKDTANAVRKSLKHFQLRSVVTGTSSATASSTAVAPAP